MRRLLPFVVLARRLQNALFCAKSQTFCRRKGLAPFSCVPLYAKLSPFCIIRCGKRSALGRPPLRCFAPFGVVLLVVQSLLSRDVIVHQLLEFIGIADMDYAVDNLELIKTDVSRAFFNPRDRSFGNWAAKNCATDVEMLLR